MGRRLSNNGNGNGYNRGRAQWRNKSMEAHANYGRGPMGHCPPAGLSQASFAQLAASQAAGYAAGYAGEQQCGVPSAYAQSAACPTNVNDNRFSCQVGMCAEQPPVCGCNVIGANSFNQAVAPNLVGLGVPSGATVNLPIDAGDSCRYQGRSMLIVAYEADENTAETLATPCVSCPVLLLNARVGTVPMIRRVGSNAFGIISDGYSDRKELTCIDWAPFTSVQNQGLTLSLLNIATPDQHIFTIIWGDNLG